MTFTVIAAVCVLLLLAYVFDLTSVKTRIPAVILLLTLGWGVRQLTDFAEISIPDLAPVLPFFGTIGLILIVLEGSLELELERSKLPLVGKSIIGSFLPILALAFTIAFSFTYFSHSSLQIGLVNALPFCIISSAIAISSVKSLSKTNKEFIIYESSLSDIFGVLIFNFLVLNDVISFSSFSEFIFQIIIMVLIAFAASLSLSLMLGRIEHHIKYAPVVILTILIYAVSEIYHLPALIFIMIFGMFAANLAEFKNSKWMKKFRPEVLEKEVVKLRELNTEGTFLIRSLFFLMFGFLIETQQVINLETLPWAVVIVGLILLFRVIQLLLSRLPLMPLLFIAPRGLITILLFISIPPDKQLPFVDKSLIIQVILISAVVMMVGLIFSSKSSKTEP
jgi:cell volume regulation protein A